MRILSIKKAQVTHPTGDPNFSVMQAFPAAISAEEADPFLMCDHFGPSLSNGVETDPDSFPVKWHPHRGIDILTYLVEGVGRHADSLGNRGEYLSPGMQWISVGSGIEHAEGGGTPKGEYTTGFQIWVNVPSNLKMNDPRYGTNSPETIPIIEDKTLYPGMKGRLLAGNYDKLKGPFETAQDVQIFDLMLEKESSYTHFIPHELDNCIVYVYKGRGMIADKNIVINNVIHLDASNDSNRSISFQSQDNALSVMIFAG